MTEKKLNWTAQQKLAISARGGDVLVTASAGTGKTAVLSGRCVDIISDKSICPDVFSLLVLTFTDAAAEEMKSRIAAQLKTASMQTGDRHLRQQMLMLQGAQISTIHSFCKKLITENFYKLGLDPTFGIIDSDEQKLLKAQALEKTIEWAWQQNNLQQGLRQLLRRRKIASGEDFTAKIIELSDFLDTVISRRAWLGRAVLLAESANPFSTNLGQKQKEIIAEKLTGILKRIKAVKALYEKLEPEGKWKEKCDDSFITPVAECVELLESGDWVSCADKIINYKKPTVNKPKGIDPPFDRIIGDTVKKALEDFRRLSTLAVVNPRYLEKVAGGVSLQTRVLIELIDKFDKLYSQSKRALNCLDFADLEHYTLKLLAESCDSDEPLEPSQTALSLHTRFRHIFVDEYQDINPVQEAILKLLTPGGNIFVVGDVKQSIYAFRGAKPNAFLQKLKIASADPAKTTSGLRVDLTENWRCQKGIIEFVNKIFARIMTASLCDMDYDKSAWLRSAATENTAPVETEEKPAVEFHILDETMGKDNSPDESLAKFSNRQRQAMMVAMRIKEMVGAENDSAEFEIFDTALNKYRPVEYRDIAILMRSPAKRANDYIEIFRLASVPVSSSNSAGYFEAAEISDCLCLLKILDNPQRDIELAAVLRSPFFEITDSELAKIRLFSRKDNDQANFYNRLLNYRRKGPDSALAEKLRGILETIETWRSIARKGNLADLLWQIYRQRHYLSFVSALANGRQRRANLLKLHDRAIQFEGFASSSGIPSLTRFVEFVEKLQQTGRDWTSAEPAAQAENAVRIISVHKSKGLEFPVVFLAELNSQFNKKDTAGDCLADIDYTLGLRVIDSDSNAKLSSLAHQVIAEKKASTGLAEEMRILYVAATRARERLILTACKSQDYCRSILRDGFIFDGETVADWQLRSSKSPLDWILYALGNQRSLHEAFETGLEGQNIDDKLFALKLYSQAELEMLSEHIQALKKQKSVSQSITPKQRAAQKSEQTLLGKIKRSLDWRYGFGDAPQLPAKQSVSELTHNSDEYFQRDYTGSLGRRPKALFPQKDFAGSSDSRIIGTATHLVIAELDLAGAIDPEAIKNTKAGLAASNAITGSIAEKIEDSSICAFFQSPLGQKALDAENTVWREWQFSFPLPPAQLKQFEKSPSDAASTDETVIIQGIIDMIIRTPQGLNVIDFKTDRFDPTQIHRYAELYKRQLELYSQAASAILKTPVAGKWLYFLNLRREFEIR